MVQELDSDSLEQVVGANELVMVQYGATWCGACKIMKPKMKRLAGEFASVKFVYVDAEKFPASRKLAQVSNLPTFAAFKGGTLMGQAQTNKEEVLKNLIDEITNN